MTLAERILAALDPVVEQWTESREDLLAIVTRVITETQKDLLPATVAFLNEAPQEGDYALLVISLKGGGPTVEQQKMIAEYGKRRKRLYEIVAPLTGLSSK